MKRCPECQATYPDEVEHCEDDGAELLPEASASRSLVGTVLDGRFRLEACIGEGGMGTVYRGVQEPVDRPVAIKVLRPDLSSDKDAVKRFFHEARVVSKLRHPNTVTLYDFGQAETGELFIAMEHLAGETLDERMTDEPLTLGELLDVVDQICQSLREAHDLGVIHRDLKPDNIFLDRIGGSRRTDGPGRRPASERNLVKVFDFGIAKMPEGPRLTQTGMVFGTPAFMSPEQAQGFELDARSDVYSLGVMFYWLLGGSVPFDADAPMQVALKHVTERPIDVREVSRYGTLPSSLNSLVMDMLAKSPGDRPQSADEVRRGLRAVIGALRETDEGRRLLDRAPGPDTLKQPWSSKRLEHHAEPPTGARVEGVPRDLVGRRKAPLGAQGEAEDGWPTEADGLSASFTSRTDPPPRRAPGARLWRMTWKTTAGRLFAAAGVILVAAVALVLTKPPDERDVLWEGAAAPDIWAGSGRPKPTVETSQAGEAVGSGVAAQAEMAANLVEATAETRWSGAIEEAGSHVGASMAVAGISAREDSRAIEEARVTSDERERERQVREARGEPAEDEEPEAVAVAVESGESEPEEDGGDEGVEDGPAESNNGEAADGRPSGGLMRPVLVQ